MTTPPVPMPVDPLRPVAAKRGRAYDAGSEPATPPAGGVAYSPQR